MARNWIRGSSSKRERFNSLPSDAASLQPSPFWAGGFFAT
eukprot:CAMPEP_0197456328 /NCGR_PEP_ID=MMETSP1175-20131217/43052_1 /TAXON_ID=1003142 /ORGANISM="Triceratium dubium, Strain CCMP147" /LENGTH=39 /DNA_ID= /DNA_START= /DNA_END= /DNA_ORIENTATION=